MEGRLPPPFMADETTGLVRYTDCWLIDVDGRPHQGDFILRPDGDWLRSIGDEDVEFQIDGGGRLLTRAFNGGRAPIDALVGREYISDRKGIDT